MFKIMTLDTSDSEITPFTRTRGVLHGRVDEQTRRSRGDHVPRLVQKEKLAIQKIREPPCVAARIEDPNLISARVISLSYTHERRSRIFQPHRENTVRILGGNFSRNGVTER